MVVAVQTGLGAGGFAVGVTASARIRRPSAAGSRRQPSGRDGAALEAAVDFWFARWQALAASS